jgi:hypothetical protein
MHALAIGYSPAYLSENASGIDQDWPRVPLPNSREMLLASAGLGQRIASLLDTDSAVEGVTVGDMPPGLKLLALPTRMGGGSLKENELALTAGWGHAGKGNINMPGQGKLTARDYTKIEHDAISVCAKPLGSPPDRAFALLGSKTFDIHLNDVAYWLNVPEKVWHYTIGSYQVIKKWLSYREEKLLGRPLGKDEVRYVQEMVRRIAAILLFGSTLDDNYRAIKADTFAWREDQIQR